MIRSLVITRLTETWKAEQRAFAAWDLSGVDFVYLWADGVHVAPWATIALLRGS